MSLAAVSDIADPIIDLPDPLVVNPGRLSILMALAASEASAVAVGLEFVDLRRQTRLTDGNLACHARRLAGGGLIDIAKQFRAGKPVTTYLLTSAGREALTQHATSLMSAIHVQREVKPQQDQTPTHFFMEQDEDWVD